MIADKGYKINDFDIWTEDIGKKEPLAVLKIVLRANDGSENNCRRSQPLIEIYPDLGSNFREIRAILPFMGYESPGIHCLDIQPGVGKTHAIMDFLKIEENFIVVTGKTR